ncbi:MULTISPECIES: DsbC family protein [unclassified Sphingomonas]|uniref:DsbC family protein n=1 Tax=unclassified Sphingomonas TaxID=196159 RepID=UPI0009274497|nr:MULTISPECIES: DsbC family protein [unclassified Sphingomonas]MBN8848024.1 DsbC family protein [Sphingomonas sp.]OJV29734.1 MAG: disulfide bond formation protein DsbC [Sphingomonas sp. 67-36]
MSATDRPRPKFALLRSSRFVIGAAALTGVGIALAAAAAAPEDARVTALLKVRLPKTQLSHVDCSKVAGLCEVTAGSNLFYVDSGGRYLVIGRVYDMETRQDLTAARLLEINPDMLVGGAARANAAAAGGEEEGAATPPRGQRAALPPPTPRTLSLTGLPKDGAIVWGNPAGRTVTVFTDFRCGYCRALTSVLQSLNVRVVERPISVLGSRDLADRVYCARNRERALHAAYADEPIGAVAACDTSGLDANEKFARAHGLSGTPVIVRDDGAMLEGFRPKEFLDAWLRESRS